MHSLHAGLAFLGHPGGEWMNEGDEGGEGGEQMDEGGEFLAYR